MNITTILASKNELRLFLKAELDIVPSQHTLDDVWDCYHALDKGNPMTITSNRSRGAQKTLTCAIIQWLGHFHFDREGVHITDRKAQADAFDRYILLFNRRTNQNVQARASVLHIGAAYRSSLVTTDEIDRNQRAEYGIIGSIKLNGHETQFPVTFSAQDPEVTSIGPGPHPVEPSFSQKDPEPTFTVDTELAQLNVDGEVIAVYTLQEALDIFNLRRIVRPAQVTPKSSR